MKCINVMTARIKNILYVENGIGYGGAIICLRHLVRQLDKQHFKPLLVTGRKDLPYQDIPNDAQWQPIIDRHIDVVGLRAQLKDSRVLSAIPGLSWLLNQVLARLDDIFNFLPFFLHLLWVARRFKADLIHANNEPLCNRAALLVGKLLHIPIVCHVRGDLKGSRMMACAYRMPTHFISVSQWVAKSMQALLQVPAEKISVIYDGIALENLELKADGLAFRRRYAIPVDAYAVGLVGLLIPWKGQALFLDAAIALRDKIPNLKMLIVGGTPDECVAYEALLRQRVSQEHLDDLIIFTGHVTAMEHVYNGLDVVVSASTSPEPLGTVVIEAMAMGRPLIGPRHGGAEEMIEHLKTGLLFTPNDALALASELERLYKNPALALQLGQAARAHALDTFAIAHHTEQIQALYQQLLQQA
jgi:glycosyltransferase involved in cell wall biosynthesis